MYTIYKQYTGHQKRSMYIETHSNTVLSIATETFQIAMFFK